MFTVQLLPAEFGDCIWIEFGSKAAPHRILIDAGTKSTYPALKAKLEALPAKKRTIDLLVVSHIDVDHIGGVLPMLADEDLDVTYKDVWFNGYGHIVQAIGDDTLGGVQGEELSARLVRRKLPWNRAFGNGPIVVPTEGDLPQKDVAGMTITLLSPRVEELRRLQPEWESTCKAAGLVPGVEGRHDAEEIDDLLGGAIDVEALADSRFKSDASAPNGSSIAFVASYRGTSVLFGADAFPRVLCESLARMPEKARKSIGTVKLPHHGSRNNLSKELVAQLSCHTFLFSSNGKQFSHPNKESVARIIQHGRNVHLVFNYRTKFNACWDNGDLMRERHYTVEYGDDDGVVINL